MYFKGCKICTLKIDIWESFDMAEIVANIYSKLKFSSDLFCQMLPSDDDIDSLSISSRT